MKPRDPEASRLEADYLLRIRNILAERAGRTDAEAQEVVESVREHIEEAAQEHPSAEITLSQMASILERLGAPETYAGAAPSSPPPAPAPAPPASPPAFSLASPIPEDLVSRPFDIAVLIGDAWALYSRNLLPLIVAGVVTDLLSVATFFIVAGPLWAGTALMLLRAIDRKDHRVDFGDLFRMFSRFWPFLGAFFLVAIATLAGFMACIVPGILLATVWSLGTYFMVEKNMGIVDSLRASYRTVTAPGRFGINLLLVLLVLIINGGTTSIPYVGLIINWLIAPLTWCAVALAYVRQTRTAEAAISALAAPAAA